MSDELSQSRPVDILLVEDNENDVILMRQGFKRVNPRVNLHHVKEGEECLAFLRRQGAYTNAPTPALILLDLNMPRKDGREVLAEITADEHLCHLPVVILTTSADEQEIRKMYQLRCSSYIVKPVNFAQFLRVIQLISDYWLTAVVLPTEPQH